MRKKRWRALLAGLLLLFAFAVAGCGGGPKADVPIFIMFPENVAFMDKSEELQASLQQKLGERPTVSVYISPIFNMEKLIVELAAGDNGVFILPKKQFDLFLQEGGFVSLDDVMNKDDFPEGVFNGQLYGVPVHDAKWLKEAGYRGGEMIAFIPARAKKQEEAKQVIKAIAEK